MSMSFSSGVGSVASRVDKEMQGRTAVDKAHCYMELSKVQLAAVTNISKGPKSKHKRLIYEIQRSE